jgi:hypothetical protein
LQQVASTHSASPFSACAAPSPAPAGWPRTRPGCSRYPGWPSATHSRSCHASSPIPDALPTISSTVLAG